MTNKKKKGGGGGSRRRSGGGGGGKKQQQGGGGGIETLFGDSSCFGQQNHHQDNHQRSVENNQSSMYMRYKKATQAVRDWYASILPDSFRLKYVTDLTRAADHVLETNMKLSAAANDDDDDDADTEECNDHTSASAATTKKKKKAKQRPNNTSTSMIVASAEIFDNLSESIDLRTRIGKRYRQNNSDDEGHRYIVDCLKYCRKLLRMSQRNFNTKNKLDGQREVNNKEAEEDDDEGGRYSHLVLDSDGEEDELEEDNTTSCSSEFFTARKPSKPVPPPTKEMLLDELINGDDTFHAMTFLSSTADLMNLIMTNAVLLKHQIAKDRPHMLQHLIQFTLIANLIMERVQIMEAELVTSHPHLDTFYKVLALVYLRPHTIQIQNRIDPSILHKQPNLVKEFVGDFVEMGYRNDNPQRRNQLLRTYARAFKMDTDLVTEHAQSISLEVTFERMLWSEQKKAEMSGFLDAMATDAQTIPHEWFLMMGAIGGKNSILNTQYITQLIFEIASERRQKLFSNGTEVFGTLWDETTNPANALRGGMDTLLAEEILPELIECTRDKGFSNFPYHQSLCPLLGMMSAHFGRGLEQPVPVSLTFGIHAMLITMLVVQGNSDISVIGVTAKASYEKLFDQLEELSDKSSGQELPPHFYHSINSWKLLRTAPEVVGRPISTTSEMNAMWNPLVAGSFLLLGTFCGSVGLGSQTLNGFGQQRLCLQLYNAFKELNLLEADDVPVLKMINEAFAREKAIWVASSPPGQGSFTRFSMMSFGRSAEHATRYAHILSSEATSSKMNNNHKRFQREMRNERRQTSGTVPRRYSAIWGRIVLRDCSDDVSFSQSGDHDVVSESTALLTTKNSLVELLSEMNLSDPDDEKNHLEDIFSQINEVAQCMKIDGDNLLPLNLPLLGGLFNQFLLDLSEHMGWQSDIDQDDGDRNNRVYRTGMTDKKKRDSFDTSEANIAREVLVDRVFKLLTRADLYGKHDKLDRDDLYNVKRAAHFMKFYFSDLKLKREDYTFFVQPSEGNVAVRAYN